MKGRGLVLHKPTRPWAALSLTTTGHRDRAGGPRGEPVAIRSTRNSLTDMYCCVASPLGSQVTCSEPETGSGGGEPRLAVFLPLMVSAGHTHTWGHTLRQVPHTDTDLPLTQHKWGLRPREVVRHFGLLPPRQGNLAASLKKPQQPPTPPTGSTENK